jgi:hypothetical protein
MAGAAQNLMLAVSKPFVKAERWTRNQFDRAHEHVTGKDIQPAVIPPAPALLMAGQKKRRTGTGRTTLLTGPLGVTDAPSPLKKTLGGA